MIVIPKFGRWCGRYYASLPDGPERPLYRPIHEVIQLIKPLFQSFGRALIDKRCPGDRQWFFQMKAADSHLPATEDTIFLLNQGLGF